MEAGSPGEGKPGHTQTSSPHSARDLGMTHRKGPMTRQLECHLMNRGERQLWGGRG